MKFFYFSFTFLLSLIPVSILRKKFRNSCAGFYDDCKRHPAIAWGRVCCENLVCKKNGEGKKKCLRGLKDMGDSCFSDNECPYGGCVGIFRKTCELLSNGSKCESDYDCKSYKCAQGNHHSFYRCTPSDLEKHNYWT
jgi:hypothetical protein